MHWLAWVVVGFALLEAGWFTFDGSHALAVGEYVTPKTGVYAGQLGPWSKVVSGVGIDPRSKLMQLVFVVYGVSWLVIIVYFTRGHDWAWWGMMAAAIGLLWYLPFGTLLAVIQIVLLVLPPLRSTAGT